MVSVDLIGKKTTEYLSRLEERKGNNFCNEKMSRGIIPVNGNLFLSQIAPEDNSFSASGRTLRTC